MRCVRFEPAQPQNRKESILGKPVFMFLACETLDDILNFFATDRITQMNEKIGRPDISIVLDDFVFQDEVIPECVPSQLRYKAVVLMEVLAIMCQDEIRRGFSLQFFEEIFYLSPNVGEKSISKPFDSDFFSSRIRQKEICTLDRFIHPLLSRSQHDPAHSHLGVLF